MKRVWCLTVPLLLLFGIVGGVLYRALQLCHGHFGYPMDDTYIHMAIAKNFALHRVWGVTQYAFSSSTSSPLYTLLLSAVYVVTGVRESTPLLLNVIAAAGLTGLAYALLRRAGLSYIATSAALIALVLLMPLPAVAESGMEHVLHTCFTLLFLHQTSVALTRRIAPDRAALWLVGLSPLLVMTRYEGVFLVFTAAVLFTLQKRWRTVFGILATAGLPLAAYGAISVANGWLPLPNSILLKANVPHGSTQIPGVRLLWNWAIAGAQAPHVASLCLLALALLWVRWRRDGTIWNYASLGLTQFIAICLMHLEFARTGWFYRYEAYLVATGIVTCSIAFHDLYFHGAGLRDWRLVSRSWVLRAGYVCALLAAATLGFKSFRSIVYGPRAYHNIYEQQYQMARFVGEYYPRATIVLNDIGAVCFFTSARVLDVYGLGSMEPARAKLRNGYNTAWLRGWAAENHASLAILYPKGWAGESFAIPADWSPMGTWTLSDNFVLAGDAVELLAIQPDAAAGLATNLSAFRNQLPPEIASASHATGE